MTGSLTWSPQEQTLPQELSIIPFMRVCFIAYSVQTVLEVGVQETGEGDDVSRSGLKRVRTIER